MAPKKKPRKTAREQEAFVCPVCLLLGSVRDMTEKKSAFFQHMQNARVEFLEAIKALIDERIEAVKKGTGTRKSRLTKIKVED